MNRTEGSEIVNLREYFTLWLEQADRRYTEQFAALEKGVSAAFAASEKAISKAENATEKRFDAVNEFRGTLADQAATLLPRSEADARFESLDTKYEDFRTRALADITALQVWQGKRGGAHEQEGSGRTQNNWLIGAVLGGIAILATIGNTALILAFK